MSEEDTSETDSSTAMIAKAAHVKFWTAMRPAEPAIYGSGSAKGELLVWRENC